MSRAPQPGMLTPRLEVQQLSALPAEYRLALPVVDHQYVAHLKALPLKGWPGPQRSKKTL
jgi:hypothetical protein